MRGTVTSPGPEVVHSGFVVSWGGGSARASGRPGYPGAVRAVAAGIVEEPRGFAGKTQAVRDNLSRPDDAGGPRDRQADAGHDARRTTDDDEQAAGACPKLLGDPAGGCSSSPRSTRTDRGASMTRTRCPVEATAGRSTRISIRSPAAVVRTRISPGLRVIDRATRRMIGATRPVYSRRALHRTGAVLTVSGRFFEVEGPPRRSRTSRWGGTPPLGGVLVVDEVLEPPKSRPPGPRECPSFCV